MSGEQPRRADARVSGRRRFRTTRHDIHIGRGIDGTTVDDHPEIEVRTIGEAGTPNCCYPFTAIDGLAAVGQYRRDQAQMAVDADEPWVLDKHLKPPDPHSLDPYDRAGRHRDHWTPNGRRKIDPIMERPSERPVRQNTRAER